MIDFFTKYETVQYEIDGIVREVTNIVISEIISSYGIDNSIALRKIEIREGETPFSIADVLYGNIEYYWTILYINNIINPFTQWYMSQNEFERYVTEKYKEIKINDENGNKEVIDHRFDTHHYEIRIPGKSIRIADDIETKHYEEMWKNSSLPEHVFRITNFEYELNENEKRRTIMVINPSYIDIFVDKFHQIISNRGQM